ncbi:MAG TPA: type II secretion system minor pseudopilin GspI [Gammaproteobacteria bacterium]|nr:type II secretion system minor pseudopilin GspI [Gammaproteobacteria bacterium]
MRNPDLQPRREPEGSGFTLIEVLVALAVIALALSAIIRATGVMTANTAHLKEKTYAHWVAMNRVTELRVTKAWPSVGNTDDDVEMFGQEWRWTQKVSQLAFSEHMRQVEISVIHRDGDEDYPLTRLTAFLLDPALISQTNPTTLWQGNSKLNPNGNPDPDGSGNPNGSGPGIGAGGSGP